MKVYSRTDKLYLYSSFFISNLIIFVKDIDDLLSEAENYLNIEKSWKQKSLIKPAENKNKRLLRKETNNNSKSKELR